MVLEPVWTLVRDLVFSLPSSEELFNPYRDRYDDLDVPGADGIRRENLKVYLENFDRNPRVFLLAEAPGPWGCRFSGVPLVSEAQLVDPDFPVHGRATSLRSEPYSEYSARIVWRVLMPWFPRFFIWNTVPLHPHKRNHRLSIRTPRAAEVKKCLGIVEALLEAIEPDLILAIGRKAEYALGRIGRPCVYIRHPSQGGALKFEEGVRNVIAQRGL